MLKKVNKSYLALILAFTLVFLLTRLPRLYNDTINPDGVNWHYRAEQFVVALKSRNFVNTYQHYHPGVTLMWLAGGSIELYKQLNPSYGTYTQFTFQTFDYIAKLSLVFPQLILSLMSIVLLYKIFVITLISGNKPRSFLLSLGVVSLFTLEPFFVGNSRLFHLDILLTLLVFNGICLAYLSAKSFRYSNAAVGALFLAGAFLTKSIGIGALVFVLGFGTLLAYINHGKKVAIKYLLTFGLLAVVLTIVIFPALWVRPIDTIINIFSEGERIGIRNGHGQIVMGEYTRDAGPIYYPLVLLLKVSPFLWVGVLSGVVLSLKKKKLLIKPGLKSLINNPLGFLGIFYLGYFLVMVFPSKKIDRYMLPEYPYLALLSVYGYYKLGQIKRSAKLIYFSLIGFGMFLFFIVYPLITFYPYYFTYSSPIFGGVKVANSVLAQKPFGIGMYDLKQFILERYFKPTNTTLSGDDVTNQYPALGFIDVKPMRAIYPNSKVHDIREIGTSKYDIIVLGIGEEFPENVLKSKFNYVKDSSMYINGLEYWRVYVKETK